MENGDNIRQNVCYDRYAINVNPMGYQQQILCTTHNAHVWHQNTAYDEKYSIAVANIT